MRYFCALLMLMSLTFGQHSNAVSPSADTITLATILGKSYCFLLRGEVIDSKCITFTNEAGKMTLVYKDGPVGNVYQNVVANCRANECTFQNLNGSAFSVKFQNKHKFTISRPLVEATGSLAKHNTGGVLLKENWQFVLKNN